MKANKMTNEELARELIETVGLDGPFCQCDRCMTVLEAAARLRNATVREMAHRAAVEAYRREVKDLNSKRQATICDLRRRLNVAEDALKEAVDEFCANCTASADDRRELCDQCVTCDWKEALAAIRGEGGAE